MAVIKKHDFVEIEYTGRLKEDGIIFDTTEEKVAKESLTPNHVVEKIIESRKKERKFIPV